MYTIDELTALLVIVNVLLVIVTGSYAYFTFKILKANEGVLHEMKEQRDLLYRPYISISPVLYSDGPVFYLKIKNTGQTGARNLRLSLDRDFYQWGEKKDDGNLKNLDAFSSLIDSFVPGQEMLFYLAQGFIIFGKGASEATTPSIFTVTAEYEYFDKKVQENTVIDLRPYLSSVPPREPIVSKLKEIKEAIEKK